MKQIPQPLSSYAPLKPVTPQVRSSPYIELRTDTGIIGHVCFVDYNGHNSAFVLCIFGIPAVRMSYLMIYWCEGTSLRSPVRGNMS